MRRSEYGWGVDVDVRGNAFFVGGDSVDRGHSGRYKGVFWRFGCLFVFVLREGVGIWVLGKSGEESNP